MTGPFARHLQQVLSAGNSSLWLMFTKSQCEGPPYLCCRAESLCSGLVLWLFGIYLVIRPLKSGWRDESISSVKLALTGLFRVKRAFVGGCSSTFFGLVLLCWSFESFWTALSSWWPPSNLIRRGRDIWVGAVLRVFRMHCAAECGSPRSWCCGPASSQCSWPTFGFGMRGSWSSQSLAGKEIWHCFP